MGQRLNLAQPAPIFSKIAIVGLGRVGGSIALAARRAWPKGLVIGVDTNKVLEHAMVLYAVDVAAADLIIASEAELVILASPGPRTIELLDEIPDAIPGSAVITTTSADDGDIAAAAASLPSRFTFVGGRPEIEPADDSILHASADLFNGRPWILTPRAGTPPDALDLLQRFVAALGAKPTIG